MAVTLIGEIVNSCDTVTGFNQGNIGVDDDWVEGAAAIGLKIAASYQEIYTTTLGAGAPYDFSIGGTEEGYHYILWFNTKMPQPTTGKLRCIIGNGTDRAEWIVDPTGFYKGGFITKVISPTLDFDTITAGTWTTGSNPSQLTAISQMGGGIEITPGVMGNFNNGQLDQMTVGLGLRVDAGTIGVPNTFEIVRAADEDITYYGWWASSNGAIIGKGKLFIGPSTLSATSVFTDTAFVVIFADERVASDFYEINIRGAGTDVSWELSSISSANSNNVRWGLTIDPTTKTFNDINSVLKGANVFTFNSSSILTGTTFIDCTQLIQSGSTIDGCTILDSNTISGNAFMTSNTPSLISDTTFEYSVGHAIEITETGSFTFSGNVFNNYLADDTSGSALYNNSGGPVTMSIVDASIPTIRNSAGSTTLLSADVAVTLTGMRDNTEVRVFDNSTSNPQVELAGVESATDGTTDDRSFSFSLSAGTIIDIAIISVAYENERIPSYTVPSSAASLPIQQRFDRNYNNP